MSTIEKALQKGTLADNKQAALADSPTSHHNTINSNHDTDEHFINIDINLLADRSMVTNRHYRGWNDSF